eukprot:scaffold818_cov388-Pavlova_lutheri.AAC.10
MDPPTWIPTWHPERPTPHDSLPDVRCVDPGSSPDRIERWTDETGMRGRRTNGGDGRSTLRRLKWRQQSPRRSDGHNSAQA